MVEFMQQGTAITSEVYCETLKKKLCRDIQNKRRGMLTSGIVLFLDNAHLHTAAHTRVLQKHFNWELFDHPPYSPDTLRVTITCLPTWKTGWNHSTSTIMRSWWKVSKRGWAHRRQTSLTEAHKNLFPDMTSVTIPAVTTLRIAYVYMYFLYIIIFFFIACFVNSSPEVTFLIAPVHHIVNRMRNTKYY
jgi:hypothetical protein